eukprot:scaffold1402_cov254-Pinguiococcus_pyrenoidosus.AAC.7
MGYAEQERWMGHADGVLPYLPVPQRALSVLESCCVDTSVGWLAQAKASSLGIPQQRSGRRPLSREAQARAEDKQVPVGVVYRRGRIRVAMLVQALPTMISAFPRKLPSKSEAGVEMAGCTRRFLAASDTGRAGSSAAVRAEKIWEGGAATRNHCWAILSYLLEVTLARPKHVSWLQHSGAIKPKNVQKQGKAAARRRSETGVVPRSDRTPASPGIRRPLRSATFPPWREPSRALPCPSALSALPSSAVAPLRGCRFRRQLRHKQRIVRRCARHVPQLPAEWHLPEDRDDSRSLARSPPAASFHDPPRWVFVLLAPSEGRCAILSVDVKTQWLALIRTHSESGRRPGREAGSDFHCCLP